MNREITYTRDESSDDAVFGEPPLDPLAALELLLEGIEGDDYYDDPRNAEAYAAKVHAQIAKRHWKVAVGKEQR